MRRLLIFAGTTEGRSLSEHLSDAGIYHTLCVATGYGRLVLKESPFCEVREGRLDRDGIYELIASEGFDVIIDATHPYAARATENIRAAAENAHVLYLRLLRDKGSCKDDTAKVSYFDDTDECIKALCETSGNILLTTGSRDIGIFCACKELADRIYVRVLPSADSITECNRHGIAGKHIIAMQGPFSSEMNEAVIRQYDIEVLVTKDTGTNGGFDDKITAAVNENIKAFVIGRPLEEEGLSLEEILGNLEDMTGKDIIKEKRPRRVRFEILLAGVGMGSRAGMTLEVLKAAENADIILGAERMIESFDPSFEKKPYYQASLIIPYLLEVSEKYKGPGSLKTVILFSGDSGFYSGSDKLYQELKKAADDKKIDASIRILPGISSVSYMASCIGESWHDAQILSMHGKEIKDLKGKIKSHRKTFMLVSGAGDVRKTGRLLKDAGLKNVRIAAGFNLSYPDQHISGLTVDDCINTEREGLYVLFIKNEEFTLPVLTPYRSDDIFIRDRVPMTKEEIRGLSILKLRLKKDSVVYDIGCGTGSVAVEIAGLSSDITVYAIEKNPEAAYLTERNKEKFGLDNIMIINAEAPECFNMPDIGLKKATHAFIGGSSGNMHEILTVLYKINPKMRVVINAITMETVSEAREELSKFEISDRDIVEVQVNRSHIAGRYHLMKGENPVWIFSFNFNGQ